MLTKITEEDVDVETPWAEALGGNHYRLEHSVLEYDVSVGDVAEALPDPVARVARPSFASSRSPAIAPYACGWRRRWAMAWPESRAVIEELVRRGCDFEGMHPGYIAVNIPPDIDLDAVARHLVTSGQQWEYADPHCRRGGCRQRQECRRA